MDKVAFLGTGLMGEPMALRLVEAGHSVFVFNRTKSRTDSLKERGAVVVESPGEAVINGDLTVLMLSDYSVIREVLFLGDSIRTGSKAFIQMGTISSSESLELKKTLESMDKEYMEAPVLGSIPQAKAGTLFVLFGGTEKQFGRWKGLLKNLGNRLIYMGDVGSASAAKLALNQLIASLTSAFAMSLGYLLEKGVDIKKFMEILRDSALYAPTFDKKFERMMNRDFLKPNFPLKHLLKDVSLIIGEFRKQEIDTSSLEGIRKILAHAVKKGYSELDYSALYNAIHPPEGED